MTWLNFKGHVILIHTNQIRFLSKMNISQLGFNYKPLKWVSVVSLWLTIAEYSPDNAGGGTKPVVQAPARSLILSFNGLLMHASFKQQNKPWLWHKFARTWLFLNLNPCVSLYQAQITDSVQQQHFHNQPKLSHSTNQRGVAKYSRLNWRRKLDFPVSLHACCWFQCCISPSSFLMTNSMRLMFLTHRPHRLGHDEALHRAAFGHSSGNLQGSYGFYGCNLHTKADSDLSSLVSANFFFFFWMATHLVLHNCPTAGSWT